MPELDGLATLPLLQRLSEAARHYVQYVDGTWSRGDLRRIGSRSNRLRREAGQRWQRSGRYGIGSSAVDSQNQIALSIQFNKLACNSCEQFEPARERNKVYISAAGQQESTLRGGGHWIVHGWSHKLSQPVLSRLPSNFPVPIIIAQYVFGVHASSRKPTQSGMCVDYPLSSGR